MGRISGPDTTSCGGIGARGGFTTTSNRSLQPSIRRKEAHETQYVGNRKSGRGVRRDELQQSVEHGGTNGRGRRLNRHQPRRRSHRRLAAVRAAVAPYHNLSKATADGLFDISGCVELPGVDSGSRSLS